MKDILTVFKAFADDTRLRVLKLLGRGELCVCEIAAALGIEQPRLSFHLRILKEAGIVHVRRQERWIVYSLTDTDMFIRFLLLAIEEKTSTAQAKADLERLGTFVGRPRPCVFREKKEKPEKPMKNLCVKKK